MVDWVKVVVTIGWNELRRRTPFYMFFQDCAANLDTSRLTTASKSRSGRLFVEILFGGSSLVFSVT